MNKKNILFVSSTPHVAGGETNLFALLNSMNDSKFGLYCLYHSLSHFEKYYFKRSICFKSFSPSNHGGMIGKLRLMKFLVWIGFYVKKHQIDLIYINTIRNFKYFSLVAKWFNIPVIVHIHIDESDESLKWIKVNNANLILFPSKATMTSVLRHSSWISSTKCVYVHNAVDINIFKPGDALDLRKELNLNFDIPIIGIVGQLKHIKGQHLFIEAVQFLIIHGLKAYFLIVGDDNVQHGEYITFLKEKAEYLKVSEYVQFLGYRTDIPEIMRLCDLVAVPSLKEPFGRVVIEAMACGTPVVASAVGGIVEIFKDGYGGLFCNLNDSKSLADKIQFFFDNTDWWESQKKIAREVVEKKFCQQHHTAQVESLIEKVIKEQQVNN